MKDSVHIKFFGYYNTFFQGYIDEHVMGIISEYSYKENKYIGDIIANVEELANTGCGVDSVYDIYPTYNDIKYSRYSELANNRQHTWCRCYSSVTIS